MRVRQLSQPHAEIVLSNGGFSQHKKHKIKEICLCGWLSCGFTSHSTWCRFPKPMSGFGMERTKPSTITTCFTNPKTCTMTHTYRHPLNGPFLGLRMWAGTRKVKSIYTVSKKTRHITVAHNFSKYWPIFKFFFTVTLSMNSVTTAYKNTPQHPKCVATLPYEMSVQKIAIFKE